MRALYFYSYTFITRTWIGVIRICSAPGGEPFSRTGVGSCPVSYSKIFLITASAIDGIHDWMGLGVGSIPSFHLRRPPSLHHHFFAIRLIVVTTSSRSTRTTDVHADQVFKNGVAYFWVYMDSCYLIINIENFTIFWRTITMRVCCTHLVTGELARLKILAPTGGKTLNNIM